MVAVTQCPTCKATIAPNVDHTCPRKPKRDLQLERARARRLFGIGRDGA